MLGGGGGDGGASRSRLKRESKSASGMSMKDMRKAIKELQRNDSLSQKDKAKAMQSLMTHSWRASQENLIAAASAEEERLRDNGIGKSYHDEAEGILGCKHYRRGCKLKAPCCGKFYTCRFCHDEASRSCTEAFDRRRVEEVVCMHCDLVQPVADSCRGCGESFARYACLKCRLFDDTPGKKIYHCDDCNLCRIGEGLGIDYFHCKECNACMSIDLRANHKCVQGSLEGNCPVCASSMFESTDPVTFLPCGHCMHVACYEAYTKTNYVCPLCSKSLGDMSGYFRRIDRLVEEQPMPMEYAGMQSRVFCSDCETRSTVPYHFIYHKCSSCKGYNTKVIETLAANVGGMGADSSPMEVDVN